MKELEFMELLSELPPEYIEEAEAYRPRPIIRKVYGIPVIAACLVVLIAAVIYPRLRTEKPGMVMEQETTTAVTAVTTDLSADSLPEGEEKPIQTGVTTLPEQGAVSSKTVTAGTAVTEHTRKTGGSQDSEPAQTTASGKTASDTHTSEKNQQTAQKTTHSSAKTTARTTARTTSRTTERPTAKTTAKTTARTTSRTTRTTRPTTTGSAPRTTRTTRTPRVTTVVYTTRIKSTTSTEATRDGVYTLTATTATGQVEQTAATQPQPAGTVTEPYVDTQPTDPYKPGEPTEPEPTDVRVWSKQEPADESQHYYGELETGMLVAWDDLSEIPDLDGDRLDFDNNNYIIVTYYCRCTGVVLEKLTITGGRPSYDLKIYQDSNSSFQKFVLLIEVPKRVTLLTDWGDVFRSYTGESYDYDRHPSPVPFEKQE